jgi:hypothetical protein
MEPDGDEQGGMAGMQGVPHPEPDGDEPAMMAPEGPGIATEPGEGQEAGGFPPPAVAAPEEAPEAGGGFPSPEAAAEPDEGQAMSPEQEGAEPPPFGGDAVDAAADEEDKTEKPPAFKSLQYWLSRR